MKILCNVCEKEEATVLCCADDAALCLACDDKVHAANKLAVKHERFSFSGHSSQLPKCDICQEKSGYFFCLEDRAVLCRECDAPIHRANAYVSSHQRFLLTGAKLSLEPMESTLPASFAKSRPGSQVSHVSETEFPSTPKKGRRAPLDDRQGDVLIAPGHCAELPRVDNISFDKGPSAGGDIPPWHLDDFLGFMGFNQNFGFACLESSKGGGVHKCGEEIDESCLGQEASWKVPQSSNSSTYPSLDEPQFDSMFVPDITSFPTH